MKKWIVILLSVAVCISVLSFLYLFNGKLLPEAPRAYIKSASIDIPVETASYYWKFGKEKNMSPWYAVKDKEAIIVPKNSTIKISFKREPDGPPIIKQVITDNDNRDIETKNSNEITVPSSEGIYMYSISADWSEGSAQYAIKVHVK
ncbi:hypothetical protein [Paenibacillus chitinolyticus]|uniref:hypothetical protein n=1 Tax=Paenibacillus chitinolyticus TaxID=79263 RepID=UPI001C47BEEB|nr:hypothetical protein [Paenibacillus chitinolyticus]MBV6715151.1 hypothetical protein [Paenibacillus chitinolyticus]